MSATGSHTSLESSALTALMAKDSLCVGDGHPVEMAVRHVSDSAAEVLPALPDDGASEDDRLSQLFPEEGESLEGEIVFEDAAPDAALLEPLTEVEAKQAEAQSHNWWKDRPLERLPMVEIPFFVPLADKHSHTVLKGLMRIHTELKALGLPLVRIRSDRGREFINRKVTAWTLYHGVAQTSTSGDDWKANGRTENWVRLLKRSTRTLLVAHDTSPSQWAFAMRHCAARLQAAAVSQLGVPQPRLLPWYASLALRKRSWETKPPWTARVTRATVLCPSPILRGGHLVRTEDGSYVHTEALVEVADVVELQAYEPHKPPRRLREKQPPVLAAVPESLACVATLRVAVQQRGGEEPPVDVAAAGSPVDVAAAGYGGGGNFSVSPMPSRIRQGGILAKDRDKAQCQKRKVRFVVPDSPAASSVCAPVALSAPQAEAIAQDLNQHGQVSTSSLLAVLQVSEVCQRVDELTNKWGVETFGVSVGEGVPKVTLATQNRPCLVRLLCRALKARCPDLPFVAMRVARNQGQKCCRDLGVQEGSKNLVMPLSQFQGGQLWVEDEGASEEEAVFRAVPGNGIKCGKVLPVCPFLVFDARLFHEVQEVQGDRWVLEAYTPKGWHHLPDEQRTCLSDLGFPLPSPPPALPFSFPAVRMLAFEPDASGLPGVPAYECVSTSHVLSKCRVSVMRTLDVMQDNLKRWANQVKVFWGLANSQGEGNAPAEVLRDTESQVCAIQDLLQRSRASEEEECPPLAPEEQWKELASLCPESGMEPRVCVAHAQGDPSASQGSTDATLAELDAWKPSWGEEYSSLVTTHQAVEPLPAETLQEWRIQGKKFQIIPSKLVHTLKAHTGRRKTRCVCCGNMEEVSLFSRNECYAGGVDATALRATLRVTSAWGWSISSFDVRTAFLQSRLLDKHDVPTVVKTPWLWRKHGICQEEFWLVKGALYGLCISPRSWCESRDATMSGASTRLKGFEVSLQRFRADPNLWWIVGCDSTAKETYLGIVAWYIDDALILARQDVAKSLTEFVAGLWNTTPPEYLLPGQVLVYNGFEIEQEGSCIRLHQRSFLTELLSRYPGKSQADVPALPITPTETEDPDIHLTRKCQALCGELLWLSIRTRPELCYAVSLMAQRMAKWPREAWERGLQMLKYLRRHPGVALTYGAPRSGILTRATALSDASFAPFAERSHQCCMTFLGDSLITWHSSRQPFSTQSTCEAELVALCSALSDLEAQLPLYQELLPASEWTRELLCDNKSAVAICQAPFGSWRSRHLHLRANVIKERLTKGWTLRHQPGVDGIGLDVESVPSEAKCQSLLRAWILLEIIGSLPVGETAEVESAQVAATGWTARAYWTMSVLVILASAKGYLPGPTLAWIVLGAGLSASPGFLESFPFWLWTLALGFGLGIGSPERGDRQETKSGAKLCTPAVQQEEEGLPDTPRTVDEDATSFGLGLESRSGLWAAYGDDFQWIEDPSDICFPRLYPLLTVKEFTRLRPTCRGLQDKVSLILRREDRDRSLLDWEHRNFLDIPGAIAKDLGQAASYEPSNQEVRQWVREYQQAENRLLTEPDSEDDAYDPEEHVSFHAAVAAYYLVNLGYQFDITDTDPEFQLWYGRIVESPPPLDLGEDPVRIASAAAFLNFQGYFFDHEQLSDDLLEEYEGQLGSRHLQEYRDR